MSKTQQLTIDQAISLAEKEVGKGNFPKALQLYNAVLQHQPDHSIAKQGLHNLQKELPRNQFVQARMTNPSQDQIDALFNLYNSGQMTDTEQACKELLQTYPESLIVINVFRAALIGQGKFHEAVQTFATAIQLKPDYPEAYSNRGIALKDLGQLKEAVESCAQAIQLNPDFANAYNNRGHALRDLGQLEEAVRSYEKAIELKPDFSQAYGNRGVALQQLGQLEEAVESYSEAIQLKPDYAEAYSNRGVALQEIGQLEQAVVSCDQAIRLKPDYAEAYSNRGVALQELGQLKEALKSYEKAVQLNPDYPDAHANLCGVYEKQNLMADLRNALHQAQNILPNDDPQLLFRLAQFAAREMRHKDVCDFLELIDPDKLPSETRRSQSELLAKTYDKMDKFSSAFALFETANEIAKQSTAARPFSAQRFLDEVLQTSKSWSNVGKLDWSARPAPANSHSLAFLIGFPRSGTTLLDTILQSHPEGTVVEEKPMVQALRTHVGVIVKSGVQGLNQAAA